MTIQANQGPGVSIFGATSAGGGGSTSPGGSSGQIQYNNGGSFGGMSGTSWDNTNVSLTITGTTLTGATSYPVLNLSQTWNNGTTTFTGLKFNATDTASAAASLLLDIGTGGGSYSSKFKVDKSGNTTIEGGFTLKNSLYFYNNSAQLVYSLENSGFGLQSAQVIRWSSAASYDGSFDLILRRAAAATLQLGAADVSSGAVAQTLQVQSNTGAGTTGPNFTIKGSAGTTAGGSIIFQTAATTTHAAALTLAANKNATFAGLLAGTSSFDGGINLSSGGVGSITIGNFSGGSTITDIVAIGGGSSGYMSAGISLRSSAILGWAASTNPLAAQDTILARDAANTLALRNGTNAQTFNIYNTYTSASEYERLRIFGGSTFFGIYVEKAGSGLSRTLVIQGNSDININAGTSGAITFAPNNSTAWNMNSSGHLLAWTDNTYDIGASGATRPRNVYIASNVGVGAMKLVQNAGQLRVGLLSGGSTVDLNPTAGSEGIWFAGDTFITRPNTAATIQLGQVDVSSGNAVAQFLRVQSTTAASQTAPDFTIQGSRGTTAGGSIIFQTAATSTYTTALTLTPAQKAEFAATIKTAAPSGGTAAEWKLGTVATVSPTSPNRTIEVDIGGTIYYIAAKTTND